VDDETKAPEPSDQPMTMNEARVAVAKLVIEQLEKTATVTAVHIRESTDSTSIETQDERSMVRAALELVVILRRQVKHFERADRPRILTPDRSVKIVR
jgi:nicotinic acid mononucleotide adenylyltransferase